MPQAAEAAWWDVRASFGGPENAFMRRALVAGSLAALACGFVGVFVVLKRIVFVGVALAEVSSAGIALALLAGVSPLAGALAFTLGGTLLFASRWGSRRVPTESAIGVVYSLAGAIAILLIARNPNGESHMLKLLQGDVLTVDARETWQMAACYALLGGAHALFAKEFTLVSFDRDAASALGLRAGAWEALLMATIGAVIAFAIRAVGVLLCSSLLVMPAVSALLLCRRLRSTLALAPVLALLSVGLGLHFSFVLDVPASALSVAVSFAILALSALRLSLRRA